jgi:hypothetical protein
MKIIEGKLRVAASDVANFLACQELTQLDLRAGVLSDTAPDDPGQRPVPGVGRAWVIPISRRSSRACRPEQLA